jgi:spermidine/putrescine transport system ATP-binding protein
LDEPLGALDLKLREHMKIELKQLQAAFGTTFVYITHDQSEALVLSDQVAVMNRGRFEQIGTPQQLYYEPATAFVASFVGASNRIFGRLKSSDGDIAQIETSDGWTVRARKSGQISTGDHVEVFVRPEAATLEREECRLPQNQALYLGVVQSLLFDGANSAVLLQEDLTRFEFRVALPQTGRLTDLKPGERVHFSFDPLRAICFAHDADTSRAAHSPG